ncbi:probable galacturonosyltransferase 7 isoform X3 [Actinidia eriantha]|uniref:probable galacturonosyltransferase 7 isoform X3 n=1 Tax=Actinidia eriantha TaxID=165200 RepID=UPI002589BEC3|nr:probable galacturonosyltransferase 7 isoform X3 [Actinidia eriantha]
MKGVVGSSYTLPPKRRWRGPVIAVLGLVLLSMLVPLVFLLGFHNGFHSATAYANEGQTSASNGLKVYDQHKSNNTGNQSKGDQSAHVDDLIRRLGPTLPKDFERKPVKEVQNKTIGFPVPTDVPIPHHTANNLFQSTRNSGTVEVAEYEKGFTDESGKSCEVKFGSYCLWRQEHNEKMKDHMVKKLKDQLYVARAYYPSIAKLPAHDKLSNELKQNIQEFERFLSETTTDADLPQQIGKKLQRMEAVIARAKSFTKDCTNVDKKLRQLVDMTEDEAIFHMKQSAFLYQLAVQTMPKSLHCLSMRLTVEYFRSPPPDMEQSLAEKYTNPALHHYVIFSNNILASSVVINSTIIHSEDRGNQVFHVLTDERNYFAMKLWFFRSTYKEATIQVLNIEDLNLVDHDKATPLHLSLANEFRISFHNVCAVRLGQLKSYLGENDLNGNSCAWMSGLNIVDLDRWREQDLSETFQRLLQEYPRAGEELFQAAALRASLIAFQDLVHPLDDTWMLSGLGHNYGLDIETIKKAAVLHFNGNMKPWIDLGIPKYRGYWKKFLNRDNQFLSDCNVNP